VKKTVKAKDIHLYFDPATNIGFKNNVMNAVNKMVFEIENKKIYKAFRISWERRKTWKKIKI
jgi:ABC-2 type transport system permease protein